MDYKINDLSVSEKEVEVTYAYEEIKSDIESEVKKQVKKIQIPGFRKGKVPISIIKKMYGDALEYEASEQIANNRFWELANEQHLHPIGKPSLTDIKFKPGEDFSFKVKYEVMPKIEVTNYTGLDIEIPDFKVTDKEVEKDIEYILKSNRTTEPSDVIGDDINYIIDVEIVRVDDKGEIFENSKPEKLQIDFTNEGIQPEIVKNAKGKKVGEYFNFSFKDEKTNKTEVGNEEKVQEIYNYKAEVKDIKKIIPAELTEELIKKVTKGKVSTEEDLRKEIQNDIQHYYDHRIDDLTKDKLLTTIVKHNEFPPPSTLVQNVLDDFVKREEEEAKKQGYNSIDKVEAADRLKNVAELEVKWFVIKNAIQEKEELKVTDDDLKEIAEKETKETGIAIDKLINYYKSSNYADKLIDKKLFNFLNENNNIKKVNPEELTKKETEETNDKK